MDLTLALAAVPILGGIAAWIFGVKGTAASANGKARHAHDRLDKVEPLLAEVDKRSALNAAAIDAQCGRIDEIRADVKTLLERIPRR